jgi:hypothetical protein
MTSTDILAALLNAYKADIITRKATSFPYLYGVYLIQSVEVLKYDWDANLPCALIYCAREQIKPACLPSKYADQRQAMITITLVQNGITDGFSGDAYFKGIQPMAREFEVIYRRETFSISDTVYCSAIDFTSRRLPPIGGGRLYLNQAHLTFIHDYLELWT